MADQDRDRTRLRGHRKARLGGSPFWSTLPSITAAVAYAIVALVWILAGDHLPDGRWLAVHLFTLGVLTNLVLVFSEHFGRTLSKSEHPRRAWYAPVANVGILAVLVGIPTETSWLIASGAILVSGVVMASHGRLRDMAATAGDRRFGWIPAIYLWAHGAFVVGAALGMAMGLGWVAGEVYAMARLAHLHVNVAGWGGLTVLATLTFFGPAIVRTRITPGADDRSGRILLRAAPAPFVGITLLLLAGLDGGWATGLRLLSATAFAVFAVGVTVSCWPVAAAARAANAGPTRRPVVAVTLWFPIAAWCDVLVVATGRWHLLDAVGLAMFLGVLGQLIAAVLTYLTPMLRSRGFAGRDWLIGRLERGELVRTGAYNLAVVAIVAAAVMGGRVGSWIAGVGWLVVAGSIAWLLVAALAPVPNGDDAAEWEPRSDAARRYRRRNPTENE